MTDRNEIIELMPLLVQGKLEKEAAERLLEEINRSPELRKEFSFWRGIHSVRSAMSRYDFSDHPQPEALQRLAAGAIKELSPEHSELWSHLQQCGSCREDLELLRESLELVPEEHTRLETSRKESLDSRILSWFFKPKLAYAPVLALMVVAIATLLVYKPWRGGDTVPVINLTPDFEKRSLIDDSRKRECPVSLSKETNKLIIAFVTDRLEIPDYSYSIDLNSQIGDSLDLSQMPLDCEETQLTNRCQMVVTDAGVLDLLKQGGSFALSVKELFPKDVDLQPAAYEYYFKVTIKD